MDGLKNLINIERIFNMSNKVLYVIPTMHCNLDCSHCFIKNSPEVYNREKFIYKLNNFDGDLILFGGEVTTHLDRMFDIIESNKNEGISKISNMILHDKAAAPVFIAEDN